MNEFHREFMASERWADMLERDVLPWITSTVDLGDDVLEIGPGPGRSTDLLRSRVARLTAVEVDRSLAAGLAARLAGSNVAVVAGDAADLELPDGRFSAAACFGVLHHIEPAATQDRVFGELFRVLRAGGVLVGSDGYDNDRTREVHRGDVFVPLDPGTLPDRLEAVGFTGVAVSPGDYDFRFCARKPTARSTGDGRAAALNQPP